MENQQHQMAYCHDCQEYTPHNETETTRQCDLCMNTLPDGQPSAVVPETTIIAYWKEKYKIKETPLLNYRWITPKELHEIAMKKSKQGLTITKAAEALIGQTLSEINGQNKEKFKYITNSKGEVNKCYLKSN